MYIKLFIFVQSQPARKPLSFVWNFFFNVCTCSFVVYFSYIKKLFTIQIKPSQLLRFEVNKYLRCCSQGRFFLWFKFKYFLRLFIQSFTSLIKYHNLTNGLYKFIVLIYFGLSSFLFLLVLVRMLIYCPWIVLYFF